MRRKRSKAAVYAAQVIEARAGLIPESDWTAEEVSARMRRTARMARVIKSHASSLTGRSDSMAISEILADLRHYCDSKGLMFDDLERAASENYEDEAEQSCMVGGHLTN